jgi:hypothetical protein
MAEAALRTAQQARDVKAAEKRVQAARQLDAVLSDQSMGTILGRLDNPLVLHMARQPSTQASHRDEWRTASATAAAWGLHDAGQLARHPRHARAAAAAAATATATASCTERGG